MSRKKQKLWRLKNVADKARPLYAKRNKFFCQRDASRSSAKDDITFLSYSLNTVEHLSRFQTYSDRTTMGIIHQTGGLGFSIFAQKLATPRECMIIKHGVLYIREFSVWAICITLICTAIKIILLRCVYENLVSFMRIDIEPTYYIPLIILY